MQPEQKLKELSAGYILKVHELPESNNTDAKSNIRLFGHVQVLEINQEQMCKVIISDGHACIETIFLKVVLQKLTESGKMFKKLDIIHASVMRHKSFLVLQDPQIIYSNLQKTIGDPLMIQDYLKNGKSNPKGDSRLPPELWSSPSELQQLGGSDLEDDDDGANLINMLTVGSTNWQVKGRVECKEPIRVVERKSSTQPGQLKIGSLIIFDQSAKIQVTLWSEAVDRYYDMIEVGHIYLFSQGEVKRRSNFNSTNNEVEISLGQKSVCTKADSKKIPLNWFDFAPLNKVLEKPVDTYWDLVGIVRDVGNKEQINTKKGEIRYKQPLYISDDTNNQVEVSCWGELCEHLVKLRKGELVILTKVRISEYNGKNLNTANSSQLITRLPDNKRVKELIIWKNQHDKAGGLPQATPIGTKNVSETRQYLCFTHANYRKWCEDNHELVINSSGTQNKLPLFNMIGWIAHLPISSAPGEKYSSYYYDKCSKETCFKRAMQEPNDPNSWTCPSCGPLKDPAIARYIGSVKTRDCSGSLYVKMNSEFVGKELYGKSAQDIKNQEVIQDREEFLKYIRSREGLLVSMRVVPTAETYQGEHKVGHKLVGATLRTPKTAPGLTKNLMLTVRQLANLPEA